jgi:hypothetical protein
MANYDKVAEELRSVIPPGQVVYGAIDFWIALYDHPFIYYERTDPWMAANRFHARYFITGDRVMVNGVHWDTAPDKNLNLRMTEVVAQSKMVGYFPDPFYGDLKVYQLQAP